MTNPVNLRFVLVLAAGCVGVRPDAPPGGTAAGGATLGRPTASDDLPAGAVAAARRSAGEPLARLAPVEARELKVTSGAIESDGARRFANRSPTLRAWLGQAPRSAAELEFVYQGATATETPLASGELRRQIGLELRARDSCNVVYVMWHIEPTPGIVVSIKSNPGQSRHAECRDRGYSFLQPITSHPAPRLQPGKPHRLAAEIRGRRLHVSTDGQESWVGELPLVAFDFDGPVGVRSDNAAFSAELRAEKLVQR